MDQVATFEVENASRTMTATALLDAALARSREGFALRRISADAAAPDWSVRDGALQHRSGGFFSVCGARDRGDERIVLYQPQGAVNGLLTRRDGGEVRFLFQARAEPGNVGEVQLGPTLQSTPANYLRFHGGRTSTYFPMFLQQSWEAAPVFETTQLDLGGLYFQKTKRVIVAEATGDVEPDPSFFWLPPDLLRAAVRRSYVINTDARAMLAVCDWSADPDSGDLHPSSSGIRRSLDAPIRPEVVGEVHRRLANRARRSFRLVPLGSLENWTVDASGISEIAPRQNVAVGYFAVHARHREVEEWVQPLLTATSRGECVLLTRERSGEVEVFVQVLHEPGLAGGLALAPSWMRYPGSASAPPDWLVPHLGDIWIETEESDEGGRFHAHCSRFSVTRLADSPLSPPEDAGVWLRVSELKSFLQTSNCCTIQLRVVASHLLGLQ